MLPFVALLGVLASVSGVLVSPARPPRGFNSFDLQWDRRYNTSIPVWNETKFRQIAKEMASSLLPHGYDTIVIDGGWSYGTDIDGYGRPIPNIDAWPSSSGGRGFKPLADWTHALGLKFGIWTLRGASPTAVGNKLPVYGYAPRTTLDEVVYGSECSKDPSTQRWCVCTWDKEGVGLNASHPAAAAYYDSVVALYAEWGVDFIKWDCMYDDGSDTAIYAREELLAVDAVRKVDRPMVLSLSPGGGMTTESAAWVADQPGGLAPPGSKSTGVKASMYRITGDFHSAQTPLLSEHAFVVGNMSDTAMGRGKGLIGPNAGVWADQDMIDLGSDSDFFGTPAAQLHATMWMMGQSPLMYAGDLPTDPSTMNLLTNPLALMINEHSSGLQVAYQGDCACNNLKKHGNMCRLLNDPATPPCVAVWWSAIKGSQCTALAVLNIGNATNTPTTATVDFDQIGARVTASGEAQVTRVYEGSESVEHSKVTVTLPGMAGTLIIVSPSGMAASKCVSNPSNNNSAVETNPCGGHRCDTVACPCGCECGTDKDPGLCYVPK